MKKWSITAAALIIVGVIVCFSGAAAMGFDLRKLDSGKYETKTFTVEEDFRNIHIAAADETLVFRPAKDGQCTVICLEEEHRKHEVRVADGTLIVEAEDKRSFADHFGITARSTAITVYLPGNSCAELLITTDTGDIEIPADLAFENIAITGDTSDVTCLASAANGIEIAVTTGDVSLTAIRARSVDLKTTTGRIAAEFLECSGDVHIRVDTGKVRLREVSCRSLASEGGTGDITLEHVAAADTLSITRSTGDVEFSECDAAAIAVRTGTGDVTGSLLTDKVFLTKTDTGKVDVPQTASGGRCEIITDTGDIRIRVR